MSICIQSNKTQENKQYFPSRYFSNKCIIWQLHRAITVITASEITKPQINKKYCKHLNMAPHSCITDLSITTYQHHPHQQWSVINTVCRLSKVFTSHPTRNWSFWRRSLQPISWLSTGKLKQAQRKQTCIRNKIYYDITWTPKKPKPGLVASYNYSLETERVYSGKSR